MSWPALDYVEDKAKKVLNNGDMPKQNVDVQALLDKASDAYDKFKKGVEDLKDQVEHLEDAIAAIKNGVKRLSLNYENSTFALDPKNKDDTRKLTEAHKMFSAFFSKVLATWTNNEKGLDDLQKCLVQLGRYQGPPK